MLKDKFTKNELNSIAFLIGEKLVAVKSLQKRFYYLGEQLVHLDKLLEKVRKM